MGIRQRMADRDSKETKLKREQEKQENQERFREIREVLRRNKITRGVTPEKLRLILEELGPSFGHSSEGILR